MYYIFTISGKTKKTYIYIVYATILYVLHRAVLSASYFFFLYILVTRPLVTAYVQFKWKPWRIDNRIY